MVIRNCEFCNAYVADFEVHTCTNFGSQHRQSTATCPRSSSGNLPEDIDLRTEQIHYAERIPSLTQAHSSWQLSIFPNISLKPDCEETTAAEVSSQLIVANQNPHNPEISDFLFPSMVHGDENQTVSAYSLQSSEYNSMIMNQNPQFIEAWNANPPANAPLAVAEPCVLPGFQQTFGQRNVLINQLDHHPNTSSQMQCSGIYHMDEMPTHFVSDFNESDTASQHDETTLGISILAVQNAEYNPMDLIPPTDAISPIHSNEGLEEYLPKDGIEPQDRSSSHAGPYACDDCDKTFLKRYNLIRHIRTHTDEKPYKCTVCNKCFTQNSDLTAHMRMHNRKTLHKCTECSESFVFRSRLEEHFRSVHPGKKLYKCKECGKCFAYLSHFKHHRLIHTKV
ncbi:hypothetical protein CDAR_92651 [Caerostris darwini]|uniref:C2H2-type domain-containing protein n=1 Tax=Caerostris darwini TaxID=1538125 RepID=A0AAV4TSJ8_9ARAC|nr:hypothetical protein CDAR_92651 [Caerostris darwini]